MPVAVTFIGSLCASALSRVVLPVREITVRSRHKRTGARVAKYRRQLTVRGGEGYVVEEDFDLRLPPPPRPRLDARGYVVDRDLAQGRRRHDSAQQAGQHLATLELGASLVVFVGYA